jgi:prefoldin subunit 5
MKLYLNDKQKSYLLEILRASENNAVNGKDLELAQAFNNLYTKIKPDNAAFVSLKRDEADTVVEFCEIVRQSLDKAANFLESNADKTKEEKEELREQINTARDEIDGITTQLMEKIRSNPV